MCLAPLKRLSIAKYGRVLMLKKVDGREGKAVYLIVKSAMDSE